MQRWRSAPHPTPPLPPGRRRYKWQAALRSACPGAIEAPDGHAAQRRLYAAANRLEFRRWQGGDVAFGRGTRDAVDLHQLEPRAIGQNVLQPPDVGGDLFVVRPRATHAHKAALNDQRLRAAQVTNVAQNALVGEIGRAHV